MQVIVNIDFSMEECRAIADAAGSSAPATYGYVQDWMLTTIWTALDSRVTAYEMKHKAAAQERSSA